MPAKAHLCSRGWTLASTFGAFTPSSFGRQQINEAYILRPGGIQRARGHHLRFTEGRTIRLAGAAMPQAPTSPHLPRGFGGATRGVSWLDEDGNDLSPRSERCAILIVDSHILQ